MCPPLTKLPSALTLRPMGTPRVARLSSLKKYNLFLERHPPNQGGFFRLLDASMISVHDLMKSDPTNIGKYPSLNVSTKGPFQS